MHVHMFAYTVNGEMVALACLALHIGSNACVSAAVGNLRACDLQFPTSREDVHLQRLGVL